MEAGRSALHFVSLWLCHLSTVRYVVGFVWLNRYRLTYVYCDKKSWQVLFEVRTLVSVRLNREVVMRCEFELEHGAGGDGLVFSVRTPIGSFFSDHPQSRSSWMLLSNALMLWKASRCHVFWRNTPPDPVSTSIPILMPPADCHSILATNPSQSIKIGSGMS